MSGTKLAYGTRHFGNSDGDLSRRCPVLTQRALPIVLRTRCAVSGTDVGYDPTRRAVPERRRSSR
eukprot:1095384-Rhodomonas_salina.2